MCRDERHFLLGRCGLTPAQAEGTLPSEKDLKKLKLETEMADTKSWEQEGRVGTTVSETRVLGSPSVAAHGFTGPTLSIESRFCK